MIPAQAQWKSKKLSFFDKPEQKHVIHYRDPLEAIKTLLGNPAHAKDIIYQPKKVFMDASKSTCIYNEMWTRKWWYTVQVRVCHSLI